MYLTLYSLPNPINLVNFFLAWFFPKFQRCSPCLLSLGTEMSSSLSSINQNRELQHRGEPTLLGTGSQNKRSYKTKPIPKIQLFEALIPCFGVTWFERPREWKACIIKFQLSLLDLGPSLLVDLSNHSWDTWESSWWHDGHPKNVFSMTSWEWMLNDRFSPLFQKKPKFNFWLLAQGGKEISHYLISLNVFL